MTYKIMEGNLCHQKDLVTMDEAIDELEAIVLSIEPTDWPVTLAIFREEPMEELYRSEWDLTEDVLFSFEAAESDRIDEEEE